VTSAADLSEYHELYTEKLSIFVRYPMEKPKAS
jgi:hypothetical protein